MKKNYAIITITGNNNYGNRLQNYALVHAINKLSLNSNIETIWYKPWKKSYKYLLKTHLTFLMGNLERKRYNNFSKFTNKYTNPTKRIYFIDSNFSKLKNRYNKIVIGSDQIWNYTFFEEKFGFFEFAEFEDGKKCFSYSASFGISSIPDNIKNIYKEGLLHLNKISVREDAGTKIVKELTGREAEIVLDPTMLLTSEEWQSIELKPKTTMSKKYILTYFLGNKTEQQNEEINELSRNNNLEIINLNDRTQLEYYCCGPSEFVYLFHNASIILTDSFHACVFSILFEKPFFVFDRNESGIKNMNSRLDTLLYKFKLENQKVDSIKNMDNVFDIDYTNVNNILNNERKNSYKFLKDALGE